MNLKNNEPIKEWLWDEDYINGIPTEYDMLRFEANIIYNLDIKIENNRIISVSIYYYYYYLDEKLDHILSDRIKYLTLYSKIITCQSYIRRYLAKEWFKRNVLILRLLKVQRFKLRYLQHRHNHHIESYKAICERLLNYLYRIRSELSDRIKIASIITLQCFGRKILSKNKVKVYY